MWFCLWDFPGKNTRKWKWSRVGLFATPWTIAYQAPPSMGFSRQEYWSGLPFPFSRGSSHPRDWTRVSCIADRCFTVWATRERLSIPSPGNLSGSPGIEPVFPTLAGRFFTAEPPGNPKILMHIHIFTEIFESFSLLVKEWPVDKNRFLSIFTERKGTCYCSVLFVEITWVNS